MMPTRALPVGFGILLSLAMAFGAAQFALAVDADGDCLDDVTGAAISGCGSSGTITSDELLPTEFGTATGLGTGDLNETIGSIIRAALGFLGVVAVVIILFGGFKWMTAGGNEDKVAEAKKLIIAGIIGLAIILSAYAIASFVIEELVTATTA